MNKKKIALIILGLVVAAGVVFKVFFTAVHIRYDDEIDQALRSQMQEDGLAALNALRDGNVDVVWRFFGPEADYEETKRALSTARIRMGSLLLSATFENFHDHYATGLTGSGQLNTIMSAHALSNEPGSYFVYYDADTENVYVSLFTSEVTKSESLFTIVWGEYEDGWKIRALDFGNFGWAGKRGPDWLGVVENVREKSGDIAAYLTLKAVAGLFRPSQSFAWKDLENRVKALYEEMAESIASMFIAPITVQELNSKPTIHGLDAMMVAESPGQVIPEVHYVSKYDHAQVDLIEEEANQMAPHMEKYFKGVTDLGRHLLFVAYEEPPIDPEKEYKMYRTIVEIK
jgi:hypothetical protein